MVVLLQTGLPTIAVDAIKKGILEDKWKSSYQFLQLAAIEKLQREGLINFDLPIVDGAYGQLITVT